MPIDPPRTRPRAQDERKPRDTEARTAIALEKIARELERLRKELAERDAIIDVLRSIEKALNRNRKGRP